jgi:hypothetical protein
MDAIEVEGSEAIEVVAQFDGAIVDVAHIVRDDTADARRRRGRWLLRGGLGALGVAALAFACAYAGVAVGRAGDAVVAICLCGGTWALLRALDRGRFDAPRAYTIGTAGASFVIAPGALTRPRHALVSVDDAGDYVLDVADGMAATLTADGQTAPLSRGRHRLAAATRARVDCGGATIYVANVAAPRRQRMPPRIDWTREIYLGGVTLAVSAFLFLVYSVPPDPHALSLDLMHGDHFARFVLTPPALPPPPPAPGPGENSAAAGHAAKGQAGALGKTTAKSRTGQTKLPGPVSRDKVIAAAQAAAHNVGILGIMRGSVEGGHVASLFRPDNPLGDGAPDILLGLHGEQSADAYGNGFDEIGRGPGGGGDGDKTIGAGPLGTVGFCRGAGCSGHSTKYARSAPTGDMRHRASAPDVVPGLATVKCGLTGSCLDKEIIRRIVRQHRNEVAFCYERGLSAHPDLTGRVVAQFTIAATGRVLGSTVAESTLPERSVSECIAQAVRRWEFPRSEQTSLVNYSWTLAPPR